MKFDNLVKMLLENNLGTRVTSGPWEVQDILKTGKVKSKSHGGNTFFSSSPEPDKTYLPHYMREHLPKGSKLGYVLKADIDKLQNPALNLFKIMFNRMPQEGNSTDNEFLSKFAKDFDEQKYKILPTDSSASDIKSIQRITKDPVTGDFKFGKERDFSKFQKIYNKVFKNLKNSNLTARLAGKVAPVGIAGVAGMNQALQGELPASMKNDYLRSKGGYGLDKKFVAHP